MVIDTHTHAWGPPSDVHPWKNGPLVAEYVDGFSVPVVYETEQLLEDMDAAGIEEAVVVGYPIGDWDDNHYTVTAGAHDRLYSIVLIDQFAPDAVTVLRDTMARDGVLGIRLGVMCPYGRMWETFDYGATWLRDAITESAWWNAVADTDAIVQILAHTSQLDQVIDLVDTYPNIRYVIDHFCHADAATAPAEGEFARLAELAAYDTVGVKLSEIAYLSNEPYPYHDAHDHVRWLLETFGRERIFWGSDFPNVSHPEFGGMTYAETVGWLDAVDGLSTTDRQWITDRAFREFCGL